MNKFLFFIFIALYSQNVFADFMCEFFEIQNRPELGEVIVRSGIISDKAVYDSISKKIDYLKKAGIVLCPKTKTESLASQIKFGKSSLDFKLNVYPPRGNGPGGALNRAELEMSVNGKPKIQQVTIGDKPESSMERIQLVIHQIEKDRGIIQVMGFADNSPATLSFDASWIDSGHVITNDSFKKRPNKKK